MQVTRKGFMTSVTAALAATALPSSSAFAGFSTPADKLRASRFTHHVGSAFELSLPSGASEVVVLKELVPRRSCRRTEQFSLIFDAQSGAAIPQGVYPVRHEKLGRFNLSLTPRVKAQGVRADFGLLT